jgi:predicted nucleic acid-binding protein
VRTCAIVRGEILFGIERLAPGKNKDDLRIQVESLFQTATCEPIHISTAQRYSQIKCAMEKGGLALGENDLWIAACAMDLGAVLVTRDKGFQHVPALIVEDWTQ